VSEKAADTRKGAGDSAEGGREPAGVDEKRMDQATEDDNGRCEWQKDKRSRARFSFKVQQTKRSYRFEMNSSSAKVSMSSQLLVRGQKTRLQLDDQANYGDCAMDKSDREEGRCEKEDETVATAEVVT
jgi:hypothetical protein